MSIGVSIVTYGRPASLSRALEAVRASSKRVDRILVYDNSPDAWPAPPEWIEYRFSGHNIGLPAAIGHCMDELRDLQQMLILDDDTIVESNTIELMSAAMGAGVGAVSYPGSFTRGAQAEDEEIGLFPWSPTLLSRDAIDATGRPLGQLFFGWDDWEYAARVQRNGFRIIWMEGELKEQSQNRAWEGRTYLDARNMCWLVTRLRLRNSAARRMMFGSMKAATVNRTRNGSLVRRGLMDGLVGRLGPPPPDLSPSIDAARGLACRGAQVSSECRM